MLLGRETNAVLGLWHWPRRRLVVGSTRHANTNFDVQLGVHLSLWLQVCGADMLDGTSHLQITDTVRVRL